MTCSGDIFETHYAEYQNSLTTLDFDRIAPILGLEPNSEGYTLPLFDRRYTISHSTVLFWRQAEYYLDPESLAMTSALLARQLTK